MYESSIAFSSPRRDRARTSIGREDIRTYIVVCSEGETTIREMSPGRELQLGRSHDCGVRLVDRQASRRHARFWRFDEAVFVEDLGSRNGTFLNGTRLAGKSERLSGGDRIRIGNAEITVVTSTPSRLATSAFVGSGDERRLTLVRDVVIGSPEIREVYALVDRLAAVHTDVLISGEAGVGKELVARRLHRLGPRAIEPFVRFKCDAVPEHLLDGELFGYERAAVAGATQRQRGCLEAAHGGTLFLEEVSALPMTVQQRLLMALEHRSVLRIGATRETPIDVRLVCAARRDLRSGVEAGDVLEGFYRRISAFEIRIPPLRVRRSDIRLLAEIFVKELAERLDQDAPRIEVDAIRRLERHAWPGNVRELRSVIEQAFARADRGVISEGQLPEGIDCTQPYGWCSEAPASSRCLTSAAP